MIKKKFLLSFFYGSYKISFWRYHVSQNVLKAFSIHFQSKKTKVIEKFVQDISSATLQQFLVFFRGGVS